MKTLLFHEAKIGWPKKICLELDSPKNGIQFQGGLQLFVAPNGYGKSTLFQTLAGKIPALAGRIEWHGKALDPEKDVFYVSEYLAFPKFIRAKEWIQFASQEDDLSEAQEWARRFNFHSHLESFLGRLSQGERRKVTWLAAHLSKKPIILMDEPLDGLDLLALSVVQELLREWKKRGKVIGVIAHQCHDLLPLTDTVFLFQDQKLCTWQEKYGKSPQAEEFSQKIVQFYSQAAGSV